MALLKIVVTGARGFIGKNLSLRLEETKQFEVTQIVRASDEAALRQAIATADAVVHLAGANRPDDVDDFVRINVDGTRRLTELIASTGRRIPIAYASSAKADQDTPYGRSKKAAEDVLFAFAHAMGTPVAVFRLPNVFGKWCRPNYNSAVATFCYNIIRGLTITIDDPHAPLSLVYVDDVVEAFINFIRRPPPGAEFATVAPVYETSVGEVADMIARFRSDRQGNFVEAVGTGLTRALYATYVSYLPVAEFGYPITSHVDQRGAFSEVLKTRTHGQFSYFTALPGVTRGGHYHHTKTEKFLIVQGEARFRFRHVLTGETHEIDTSGADPTVVETVPGWSHDVTNIGSDLLISLLWANEIFDRERPDTIAAGL